MNIVIATRNAGKFKELSRLLGIPGIKYLSLLDFPKCPVPPEDKSTYAENAMVKAEAVAAFAGLPAVADDSGLEVNYLNGGPGILSARYGGEGLDDRGRVKKLLGELKGVGMERRGARFRCVLALACANRKEFVEGECTGLIATSPRGKAGFGYDPVFIVPGLNRTMAELGPKEKDSVSHRGQAARKLRPILQSLNRT